MVQYLPFPLLPQQHMGSIEEVTSPAHCDAAAASFVAVANYLENGPLEAFDIFTALHTKGK